MKFSKIKRLQVLWRSGFVQRFHTNDDPRLRLSGDNNDAHSNRVAKLVSLFGGTPQEVLDAVWHDAPELITGDVSNPAKTINPQLRTDLKVVEWVWSGEIGCPNPKKTPLIDMCDLLDAILFAQLYAPDRTLEADWQSDINEVLVRATALGHEDAVWKMLRREKHVSHRSTV